MDQDRKIPVPGEFYRHFKNKLYQIVAVAYHSETGEKMVVYQALYGDFKVWVRPLSMFMEEVSREKYPEAAQRFRFEKVERPETEAWQAPEDGQEAGPKEDEPDGAEAMNPYLLEFFDAMDEKHYDRMLEALAKLAPKATPKEIGDLFMVLDMEDFQGDPAAKVAEIRRHILRLKKFDGERLR